MARKAIFTFSVNTVGPPLREKRSKRKEKRASLLATAYEIYHAPPSDEILEALHRPTRHPSPLFTFHFSLFSLRELREKSFAAGYFFAASR
jgi:hypothetical protein